MTSKWSFRGAVALGVLGSLACDPQQIDLGFAQKADWGLGAVATMPTPEDDPGLGCGVQVPADSLAGARQSCAFGSGTLPSQTLGIDPATTAAIPIRHVIIVMKENRSFDHLLGKLHQAGPPGVGAVVSTYSNTDLAGVTVSPFHAATTCIPFDPGHQSSSVAACVDGDKMDGFVRNAAQTTNTDGHFVMGYYDQTDLPFYYFLATTFAVNDRHFAAMATGTYGNRDFMLFGTNGGVVDTGLVFPPPTTPSLMQSLLNKHLTWGVYTDTDSGAFSGALDWRASDPGVHSMADLFNALDQGTLPNVVFVDGHENVEDDHPTADLQRGEAWLKQIYDHAIASPQWPRLSIVWTYDEAGAFADHVPPEPAGCAAEPDSPFTARGPRVPLVVISPWAKRSYVSHIPEDHAAITRFVETIFDLPALTARDANSEDLLDLFDFSCGRDLSVLAAPAAGQGGCSPSNPPSP